MDRWKYFRTIPVHPQPSFASRAMAQPGDAGRFSCVTRVVRLLRRAGDRAERTEHAAIAVLGAQARAALPAIIKKSASVDGHCFALREAATRTGDHGMKNDVSHDF
jgi:hypothetical protein